MKPKTLFILATAMSAVVLGGIHFGLRDEVSKLQARLDMSYFDSQRASTECQFDPLECPRAEMFRSRVDEDMAELQEARQQASRFLMLAIAVPGALVVLGLIVRRLAPVRTRQREKPVQAQSE